MAPVEYILIYIQQIQYTATVRRDFYFYRPAATATAKRHQRIISQRYFPAPAVHREPFHPPLHSPAGHRIVIREQNASSAPARSLKHGGITAKGGGGVETPAVPQPTFYDDVNALIRPAEGA